MRRKRPGIGRIILLIAVIAISGYLLFFRQAPHERRARGPAHSHKRPAPATPAPVLPAHTVAPTVKEPAPPSRPYRAEVAIIIDDMGQELKPLDEVLDIDAPVAVAVLPMLRYSAETSRRAHRAGRDVLLHLPMQPKGTSLKGLGKGALMEGMAGDEIRRTLGSDLDTVPGASGVNNHMGSELTEDKKEMHLLMEALKERGMYFVDSRTSPLSVAYGAAVDAGVRASSRRVFLDDEDEPEKIKEQLEKLEKLALRDGSAIAIGHPRARTLAVLKDELPALKGKGIEVVSVSSLIGASEGGDRTFLSDAKEKYQKKAAP